MKLFSLGLWNIYHVWWVLPHILLLKLIGNIHYISSIYTYKMLEKEKKEATMICYVSSLNFMIIVGLGIH